MQIMEGDLARTIESNLHLISHMQLADNPGRHEPGTGEINYEYLFDFIDCLGYQGWIGCEYVPAGSTVDANGCALEDRLSEVPGFIGISAIISLLGAALVSNRNRRPPHH